KGGPQQHRVDREEWQRNDHPQHRHGRALISPARRVAAGDQTGIEDQEDDKDDKDDVPVSEPRHDRAPLRWAASTAVSHVLGERERFEFGMAGEIIGKAEREAAISGWNSGSVQL